MDGASFDIDGMAIPVWPPGQELKSRDADSTLVRTTFDDGAAYHPSLIETILGLAAQPENARQYGRSLGGVKLYQPHTWENAAARLVSARACALFRQVLRTGEAVIDMSWANVYRRGDYIMPHSHIRATASVVYCLDPGEDDPEDPLSGQFAIVDPRFKACCRIQEHHMTNPVMPKMAAGTMLIFPGQLVHSVNPYGGRRPRITLSWNINRQPQPGSTLDMLGQPAAGTSPAT